MSTITREFTKEQLQQIIETDHVQCGEASALARIAMASPECHARPVHPRITSEELDDDTLDQLIDFRRSTFEYHSQQDNKVQTIIHGVTLTAMLELKERRAAMLQGAEPVTTAISCTK
ncbi:hypothetical protein Entas_2703 [Enterobacter soli]|uniref:hypothetical protein n=1 Tax=Enterobacter soli TaxID=885040 RepID=UPI000223C99B|nr:hypothetical protein [Enterobacter soli]AEN65430.1 hypothetical protein Entas_2703 [Enterobacter soli]OAT35829.1 hypothetical protein M987_03894 [Enterobacter soli ATCC BAA-2102]